jgi:hypothetical protein
MRDLEEPMWTCESFEAVESEIVEFERCRLLFVAEPRLITEFLPDALAHENLATVSRVHYSRASIERRPVEIAVTLFDHTYVDADSDSQSVNRREVEFGELQLSVQRRRGGMGARIKAGEKSVTRMFDDSTGVVLDRSRDNFVVASERHTHCSGVGLPLNRRSLDIGEEHSERDGFDCISTPFDARHRSPNVESLNDITRVSSESSLRTAALASRCIARRCQSKEH